MSTHVPDRAPRRHGTRIPRPASRAAAPPRSRRRSANRPDPGQVAGNATRPACGMAYQTSRPYESARQITSAAEAAARAWAQALPAAELPLITACLDMSLLELSAALGQLAQYRPVMRPGAICGNPSEPGIYIDAAAQAISCISRDLRDIADDQPGTGHDQPGTAAITAARNLADATYTAFTEIRQPSGSPAARDAAVSAFMHAIGIIDTAIGNLASQARRPAGGHPDPAAHPAGTRLPLPARSPRRLRRQPGRPAQPRRRGPGPRAAPDHAAPPPGPAPALLATRPSRRPVPAPAPLSPGEPAMNRSRQRPGAGAARQPRIPGGQQHRPHRHRPRQHRPPGHPCTPPPRSQQHERHPTCHKERKEMSQQDFEPDADAFTASPEFTEAGFSTPGRRHLDIARASR